MKKYLFCLLALILPSFSLAVTTDDIEDVNGCYVIKTADGLYEFADIVNGTNDHEANANVCGKLNADIALNAKVFGDDGCKATNSCRQWTPIGTNSNPFSGTFDGQGHVISELFYSNNESVDVGLFGNIVGKLDSYVSISNVGLENFYINAKKYVGGFAATAQYLIVTNVYTRNVTIWGYYYVGGFISSGNSIIIRNSYDAADAHFFNSSRYWPREEAFSGEINNVVLENCYSLSSFADLNYSGSAYTVSEDNVKDGVASLLLHSWCEKNEEGTTCLLDGMNGNIWGHYSNEAEVYPKFVKEQPSNLVFFNFNGGESDDLGASSFEEVLAKDYVFPEPIRGGFLLEGWYLNADLTGDKLTQESLASYVKEAAGIVNVYAKWNEYKTNAEGCYEIASTSQLYSFAKFSNARTEKLCGKLTADITLDEKRVWTPIGRKNNPFTGTFDGGSHKINGLFIEDHFSEVVGLFGYTGDATIKDLGVEAANIKNYHSGGILVGTANGTTISNSYSMGNIEGLSDIGGLVGAANDAKITDCYSKVTVAGTSEVGGLVGNSKNSTITNSHSDVDLYGSSYSIGGLVGSADNTSITGCYSIGSVKGYDDGPGSSSGVGGLVGYANKGSIIDSYSKAWLSGNLYDAGSLVGYASGIEITNCYGDGTLIGNISNATVSNCHSDGYLIENASEVVITNCYSGGYLVNYADGGSISNSHSTGVLVGTANGVDIVNCYSEEYLVYDAYGGTISNSFSIPTKSENVYFTGLVQNVYDVVFDNCFALSANGYENDASDGVYIVSKEDFNNGHVALALHNWSSEGADGKIWGQDVEKGDPKPTFTNVLPELGSVKYNLNGGSFTGYAFNLYQPGQELPTPIYLENEFLGWYDNPEYKGNPVTHAPNGITESPTYYAKWNIHLTISKKDGCYEIYDEDGLYIFEKRITAEYNEYEDGSCGKLMADITINEDVLGENGCAKNGNCKVWTPLHIWGNFDGQGHVVRGLYFDDNSVDNVGLFEFAACCIYCSCQDVQIKNLGIEDSYFRGKEKVGSIAGISNVSIANSYSTATVSGQDYVGGLVGYVNGSITNSYSAATVIANNEGSVEEASNIGSLVGNPTPSYFYNCFALSANGENVTVASKEDFSNGTVAKELQKGKNGKIWGQVIGRDKTPTFVGYVGYPIVYNLDEGDFEGDYADAYEIGKTTTLPTPVREHYTFDGWYDNEDYEGNPITTIDNNADDAKTLYAKWSISKYTITVSVNDATMGSVTGAGEYDYGTEVELVAKAVNGYKFSNWEDDVKIAATRIVTVTGNMEYAANFEPFSSSSNDKSGESSSSSVKPSGNSSSSITPTNESSSSIQYAVDSSSAGDALIFVDAHAPQFHVTVAGNSIQVAGALIGSAYAFMDMQGRTLNTGRVKSANFSLDGPRSGSYILRIGNTTVRLNVK